jgi:hypothetical protein
MHSKLKFLCVQIRDLRENGLIQLSSATFDNFSAYPTISLQKNNLACYPYDSPPVIQADVMECVSDAMCMPCSHGCDYFVICEVIGFKPYELRGSHKEIGARLILTCIIHCVSIHLTILLQAHPIL